MNIFFVNPDPLLAAQSLCDKHVVKMILESAQMLSTAHRVLDGELVGKYYKLDDNREAVLYKSTHMNHPSTVWARTSVENYNWLVDHFFGLMDEYTYRYEKTHKCYGELSYMLQSPPKNLKNYDFTNMPCCMPDEYKITNNSLTNYRQYYIIGKSKILTYKKRQPPEWLKLTKG